MAFRFFGKEIAPSCSYCAIGSKAADETTILCPKKGIVSPFDSCRRFSYDPLKRVPLPAPPLPDFQAADFSLESVPPESDTEI